MGNRTLGAETTFQGGKLILFFNAYPINKQVNLNLLSGKSSLSEKDLRAFALYFFLDRDMLLFLSRNRIFIIELRLLLS